MFLGIVIDDVGFTAKRNTISCPEDIPPSVPPALFDKKPSGVISSLFLVIKKKIY